MNDTGGGDSASIPILMQSLSLDAQVAAHADE
jgi:hypothetical protein